jgi:hypothetical protein
VSDEWLIRAHSIRRSFTLHKGLVNANLNQNFEPAEIDSSSLSGLKNRSEAGQAGKPHSGCSQNSAGRGQILTVLQVNSRSIDQKSGEICTAQADLQPISFKPDRLLG